MVPSFVRACFLLSCLFTIPWSNSPTRAEADADRQALLCIKSQLSDPAGSLASWSNASLNVCDWQGVSCSSNRQPSRVTALDLEGAKLSGLISPCVANLTFLDKMNLPNNRLRGGIPVEFGRLPRLRYLNLSNNSLGGEMPSSLGGIPSLVHVDLSSNGLTEYGIGGQISTEGDVYSFGVLLLEMLTGKRPTDESLKNGMNLHNFVKSAFPDKIGEILDPIIKQEITKNENQAVLTMHCCIIPLVKVGLLCSMELPKDRPGMGHVSTEIHAINSAFPNLNGSG